MGWSIRGVVCLSYVCIHTTWNDRDNTHIVLIEATKLGTHNSNILADKAPIAEGENRGESTPES